MKRCELFNITVERLMLWAGPGVSGEFSFLDRLGQRKTLYRRKSDLYGSYWVTGNAG